MKLEKDRFNENKTAGYLLPCLKYYGKELTDQLNRLPKLAVGINDHYLKETGINYDNHIFILINTKNTKINDFLQWIRQKDYYEDDYIYDDIMNYNLHMLVLRIPEKHHKAFYNFKTSQYSKMYDKDVIDIYFAAKNTTICNIKKILLKEQDSKIVFKNKLETLFEVRLSDSDINGEYEFPINKSQEIFNK